jgi:hypothetical protein
MRGTVYLGNTAGRALRRGPAAVRAADVLYCSGDFQRGDSIYVAFLGADGGQYVVASGIAQFDGTVLREQLGPPLADAQARATSTIDDSIVILAQDIRLLWSV